ncbi:MAG TPA: hypothetical protein P5099_01870 [Candidatus Moranbacteria bacterium]|nr:hypothetical protein [Candidatus Moranbacteria bacterium]
MLKLNIKTSCIVFSLLLSLAVSAFFGIHKSEAANQVNVTAYVVDKSGQPLADGEYSIRFAIYSRDRLEMDPYPSNVDAGYRIWQETQKISVFGGIMSAYLGAVTPLPGGIDFNQNDYYLGTQIGTDSEMAPRKKLGSALSAINSSFLQGKTVGNQAGNIPALGTNGGLDPVILDKINRVGTIGQGIWEGEVIANDFLETDFTGKTYEGLTIKTSGGNRTLTVSSNVTLNQDLSTTSTPTFAAINLTDGLPIDSGGTNATSIGVAGSVAYSDGTAYAFTGAGTAGQYLVSNGSGAPTWQTIAGAGVGGSGLAGHMPYWSDANNLAYDTDGNFYWDATNNRLGIGTATPAQALDVAGAIRSSSQFISTVASGTAPMQVSSNTLVANLNADYLDGQHASAFLTENQTITLSGDVTGSGTTSIATTIANNSVDGTDIALGSDAQGDVMYYNGTDWARLAAGTSGQFLATNGAGANPSWGVPSGAGDITAIGNVFSGEAFTGTQGTELYFNDSDGDGLLTIANLSAARTYTLPNASGTVITSGNLTDITATGTIASGTWNGGVIDEAYGGTGMAAYAEGDMLYYDGGTLTRLAAGTNGQILGAVGGAGNVNPTWMDAPFVGSHNLLSLSHPDTTAASPLAGDLITGIDTGGGTIRWQRYAIGAANDILMTNGTGNGVDWNPQTSITQLGTITAGTWNGTTIGVTRGGTGLATINRGGILYANANNSLAALEGVVGDDAEYLRFHWNGGSPYVAWETASGSFTSFTLSGDSGADQTISDANTLEIVGGTNINSVASATDTITLNLDSTLTGSTWNGNTIGVGYGGTGITGTPTNGQLLIGNGTNYTLANLTSTAASIAITNTAGGINLESSLGTSVSLTSEVTGTLPVGSGGTGAATLTDGGILLGSGTSAITPMGVLGNGSIVIGDGVTDPTTLAAFSSSTGTLYHEYGGLEANVSAYSGLLKISGGVTSYIPDNSVNWDTAYSHSLDNTQAHSDYLINNGDDSTSGRLTAAGFTTNIQNGLQFDPFNTGAGNTSEIRFMELAANGTNYVGFKAPDNIADGSGSVIWTLPAVAGSASNVLITDGSGNLSWSSVAGVGAMNSFTLSGDSGADQTIDDADILEIVGGTNITSVASATDTITLNLDSTLTGTTWNGNTIGVGYGGTGITGTPTNGQLLIGNGTNYTLAILTDGAGINISEGSGAITIAAALGNSVDLTSEVTGILPVANGGTNTNATPTAGALSYGTGSAYAFNTAGTAGQTLLSGGAGAPTWTTGTLSLAGNFITSGANSLTLTTTGATNVTLPTGGTLATLAGIENLTNKTLGAGSTWNGNTIGSTYITNDDLLEIDLKASNTPSAGQILKYDSDTGGFSWANETGGSGSSKWTDSTTYTYLTQTSEDLVLGSTGTSDAKFLFDVSDSSITFEGATDNAYETEFIITDPTADRTITFPDGSGTVVFSGGSGSSLWTNDGSITYLTETGDDMVVGGSDLSSPLSVDVSANTVRIGDATAAGSAILNMYASDGDTGSITYNTNDAWAFEGGNVGIGDTSPLSLFTVGSGDLFQVNSSGQIAAAAGITSSGTITFSGLTTDGVVTVASGALGSEAQLAIARGGTNTNAAPTAGAISYGTGTAYAFNTAGTAGQVLLSGGAGAPTWTTGTLSLAGNFITSGANSLTFTTIGETNVTLPVGGTLATLAGSESFTNKTMGSGSTWNGNTIGVGYGGTGITGTPTNGQLLIGNGTNYTLANLTSTSASIAITNTAGGINLESSLGTSVSLTSEVTGTLPVENGGTETTTLTDGGILLGSGTSAITPMGVLGNGSIVIGDGVTDPTTLAAFSSSTGTLYHEYGGLEANVSAYAGLLKISGGATSYIPDNSANWDTAYSHSLDNTQAHSDYLINNGADSTSGRLTAAGFTTNIQNGLQFDPFNTGAGNTSEIRFMELAANGSNYVGFKAPDNIADGSGSVIWTLPALAGSNDNVLTTDSSGNLSWTSVAGVGGMNSFTLSGDSGANQTIDDADILEIAGGTNITSVASATDTITLNLDSTLTGTIWNGNTIGVGYGGTGITGTPTNGQLLIGNGTNYTLANLTSTGASIAITNTAGGINLESSLGTSISLTSEVAGILPVENGGTGITTAGLTGVPVISSGTWSVDTNALAVAHGGTGEVSEANLEDKIEGYIFDADAATILGAWTVSDNVALSFGTNNDLQIAYDETTDDRMEITDGSNLLGAFSDAGTVGNLYLTGGISTFDSTVTAGYGEFTGLCLGNGINCITTWTSVSGVTGTGTAGNAVFWTSANTLGSEPYLGTSRGGTGIDTATATGVPIITAGTWSVSSILGAALGGTGIDGSSAGNGTLLIGNGSGYSLTTLTDGTGITITEASGSITIDSTLGTSVDGTEIAIASQAQGDVLYYNGTAWTRLAAGSAGQYLQGGTAPSWDTPTGAGDVTNVGDCAGGACFDGTDDGGTYLSFYDPQGTGQLITGNLTQARVWTLPDATGTVALTSDLHSASTITDTTSIDMSITGQQISGVVLPAGVDHNSLANLTTGDYHTQYALLTGRSGGQTLIGGTASGDDLTLQTTSDVTKGSYILSDLASGLVLSTSGTLSVITNNSTNWDAGYTNRLTGVTDNVTGLDFSLGSNNATLALTSGYVIPTTTQESNWGSAYSHSTATTNVHGLSFTAEGPGGGLDADTLDGHDTAYFQVAGSYQPLHANLTSLSALSYSANSFVKMTAAGTFALDTNTYLTSYTETDPRLPAVGTSGNLLQSDGSAWTSWTPNYLTSYTETDPIWTAAAGNYFNLSENETVTGIPAFNGGTTGSSAPFTVDSTYLVTNLNADLLDGQEGSYYQTAYTNLTSIGSLANGTGWLYNNGSGTFSYSTPTGLLSGLTANYIPYATSATALGDSGMYWDSGNSRLGIGTTTPGDSMEIFGAGKGLRLSYDASNYVTLASDSSGQLSVNSSSATYSAVVVGDGSEQDIMILMDGNAQDYYAGLDDTDDAFKIGLGSAVGTNSYLTILSGGNVGIGATTPSQALELGASKWLAFEGATDDTNETVLQVTDPTADNVITFPNVTGTVWTSGNDGTGSTLDADTLDGHDTAYFQTALTNPVTGTGTAGHLAYWSSASAITYDTNGNFYWDATLNRLGIGVATPANLLSLQQTGTVKANTDMLSLTNFGNADDMDGTATSILFNQYYYEISGASGLANSGNITVGTETDWTSTVTDQDSYMAFSTVLDGTMTEGMRINSAGNVGIGTANSPIYKLEVAGNAKFLGNNQAITIGTNTGSTRGYITADTTAIGLIAASGYDAYILNNSSVGLIVKDSTGNVGINTASPGNPLHVNIGSDSAITLPIAAFSNSGPGDAGILFGITDDSYVVGIDNSDSDKFKISYGNSISNGVLGTSDRFVIDSSGLVGIGTAAPATALDVNGVITATGGTSTNWNSAYSHSTATTNVHGLSFTAEGPGGGLDADTLDGQEGSYYQTAYTNLTSIGSLPNGTGWLYNNGSGAFSYSTPTGLLSGLTANYIPYATSATALGDSGMYWDSGNSRLGIGTITPGAALQIGTLTPANITTPANSLMVSGDLEVGGSIFMGPMSFPADSGAISWIDMPVSTSVAADTVESYTASLGGTSILTIYGEALGAAGGVDATRVGIGTTTPANLLSIQQAGSATANTNIFSLTNSGNGASMTNTRTSILFNQYYYDAATPALVDSGNISVGTEGNWTSTTSTQDAYMAFSTVLNGTMAEKMRIDSAGNVGIGTTTPSQALELGASKWLAFEGATDDTNETVLQVTDPTADNTITLPNASGTMAFLNSTMTGTWQGTAVGVQYGGTGVSSLTAYGLIFGGTTSTGAVQSLGTGTSGQVLTSQGAGALPTWSAISGSLFTHNTNYTYLTTTTDDFVLGSNATANAPLFFDVSASELDIYGTTNKIKLSYDGSNYNSLSTASNGDLTIASSNTAEAALVVGNNGALDASIQFDEVTQDYYFGVDNTDHFLKMGLGTAVGTTPYFAMSTAGKIGLGGMVAPTAMLHMTGVAGTVSLEINSNETTAASNVLMVRSDVAGADDAIFRVTAEGNVYADGAFTPSGADYAEYFKTKDTDLQSGEAVCIDPENENAVVRCDRTGDNNIMGIVSSAPSVIGNARDGRENDPNYKVIGMIGQIIGNVSTENGEITIGDSLTAASTPGYMRKANAGESTVGIAMENFDGTKGQIHILISRRNQSLTVEKVEEAVEKNIAAMELQDQVDNLVSQASSNLNAQIENLSTTFSPAQKNIITAGITAATDPIIAMQNKLQSQMDLIQEQNDVIAGFIANMDVASMLYDESLNLGSGLLEADGIVAGALTVKIEDEKNKTIGSNYIEPKDEDNDGKSYVIKTKAVTETATIFTSFQANPNAYSWVEKVKDPETKEYIGFKINLNSEVSSRVYFDWWIVEKDDRTEEPKVEDSIEASTEASIEASAETLPAQTTTTTETEPGM